MQEGEPSYKLYVKEREDLLASLQRRASQLYKVLNQLEGISCNEPQGALYCMPRIRLSKKALEVRTTKESWVTSKEPWQLCSNQDITVAITITVAPLLDT